MPWFPDFVSAAELARRADPRRRARPIRSRQYFTALDEGDAHALETVWPGRGRGLRPPRRRGPRPPAAAAVRQPESSLVGRAPRPDRDRGLDVRRWAGRRRAAGASGPRRASRCLAGGRRRRIPRRPLGGVPHLLQPVAGRRTPPRPAADPRARATPIPAMSSAATRRRSTPATSTRSCSTFAPDGYFREPIGPARRAPRHRRAALVLRQVLQRGRRHRSRALRRDRRRRAVRPGVQLRPLGQPRPAAAGRARGVRAWPGRAAGRGARLRRRGIARRAASSKRRR